MFFRGELEAEIRNLQYPDQRLQSDSDVDDLIMNIVDFQLKL